MPAANPMTASRHLCLLFEFDLSAVSDYKALATKDITAAAQQACKDGGLAFSDVVGKATTISGSATLKAVNEADFDAGFVKGSNEEKIRLDFFFGDDSMMTIRAITNLLFCDGVTTSRIAFTTLEILEQVAATNASTSFKPHDIKLNKPPPLCSEIFPAIKRKAVATSCGGAKPLADPDSCAPSTTNEFYSYYMTVDGRTPVHYKLLTVENIKFDEIMKKGDAWKDAVGLKEVFYLVNKSPLVVPGVVKTVMELKSREAQYKGAFLKPMPPPIDKAWSDVFYSIFAQKMMWNNYGKHTHNFKAKPTCFKWDQIEMAGINCTGVISLNGLTMIWVRGTKAAIAKYPSDGLTEKYPGEITCMLKSGLGSP